MSKKMLRRRLGLDLFYFALKRINKNVRKIKNIWSLWLDENYTKSNQSKLLKCLLLNLKLLADIISNSAIIYVVFPEVILIIWQMLGSIKFNVR